METYLKGSVLTVSLLTDLYSLLSYVTEVDYSNLDAVDSDKNVRFHIPPLYSCSVVRRPLKTEELHFHKSTAMSPRGNVYFILERFK